VKFAKPLSFFGKLGARFRPAPQQPLPPEALLGTRVHVTSDIKGPLGDAVAQMLMDEIDYLFTIPAVRERLMRKFNELVSRNGK
jgi:hypothetical protein